MDGLTLQSAVERTWRGLKVRVRNVWRGRRGRPSETSYLLQEKNSKFFKYASLRDEDAESEIGKENKSKSKSKKNKTKEKKKRKFRKRLTKMLLKSCRYIGQGASTVGTVGVIPSYNCNCDLKSGRTVRGSTSYVNSYAPSYCIHDMVYSTTYYY